MNNNLTGQYTEGVHKCDNTPLWGDWTVKDNCNHGLFIGDIKHLLTKDRLVRLNHKIIASQPMHSKEKYKKCNIKLPCIVAKNVKNPKKLPYRLIEGSHRMQKMKDNNIKNSMFYTISESEFYNNLTEGAIKKPNHIEVIEDVLPRENMKNIQSWMHSSTFSWIYNPDNLYDSKREENPNPDFQSEIHNRFLFNHTWIWEGELRKDSAENAIIDMGILIDKVIEASGTDLIKRKSQFIYKSGKKS